MKIKEKNKKLEEYLKKLSTKHGLIITYKNVGELVLFDIENKNSLMKKYGIELNFNSIVGREEFKLSLSSIQVNEENLSEYITILTELKDIVHNLNYFLIYYFL